MERITPMKKAIKTASHLPVKWDSYIHFENAKWASPEAYRIHRNSHLKIDDAVRAFAADGWEGDLWEGLRGLNASSAVHSRL